MSKLEIDSKISYYFKCTNFLKIVPFISLAMLNDVR